MDLSRKSQTSTNTSEFDSRSIQGRESLICQTYVTFSIDFPNTYNDYLPANVIDSFFLVILVNESDILPPGAYAFLTSSVHVPLDSVIK